MLQRTCSLFGSLVLATLIGMPTAYAVCASPRNICKHIDDCLQRTSGPDNKDAEQIREGVTARNGKMVFAGAAACARDFVKKRQWGNGTRAQFGRSYVTAGAEYVGGRCSG